MAFLDKSGIERLWLHILSKLNGKVDKEDGKGLSSNDYTTDEKEQLATLGTLVGDTAVSTQINNAISEIDITPDGIGAVSKEDYYGLVEKVGAIVTEKSIAGAGIKATSYISAYQEGSGDPSPENIRPIAGWDAVTLIRTSKNMVSHLDYEVTRGHSATVITEDVIDVATPGAYDYGKIPVHLKGGVTYTLVIDWEVYGRAEGVTGETACSYRIDKLQTTASQGRVSGNVVRRYVKVYTATEDIDANILWYPSFGSTVKACSRSRVMLLEGAFTADTAPAFEPCAKKTLTVALPETIYGGTLDWTSGLLTVTHGQIASYAGENVPDGWISSVGALTDGAQVVYPLAEPYTIQLDPQQIEALQGVNTVWSDCGDTRAIFNYSLCGGATSIVSDPVEARENLLIVVSATEPTSPTTGMLWFDIS